MPGKTSTTLRKLVARIFPALLYLLSAGAYSQTSLLGYYQELGIDQNRAMRTDHESEIIDPFSGGLTLSYTDMYLPGNGKFDLQISRVYSSLAVGNSLAFNHTAPIPTSEAGLGGLSISAVYVS